MLAGAARSSVARASLRRPFATVTDVAGFKILAANNGQPTTAISLLVKGGSRFQDKPGVAHALKNFAFKNTSTRSSLRIVREAELHGGFLSSSLGREHLALTAEFLPGDEAFFVELLSSVVTSTKFNSYEFNESVFGAVKAESLAANSDPVTRAIELAHALAFRGGLGNSLFAPLHPTISAEDVKIFAASAFSSNNIAVLGTGIDSAVLSKLVEKHLSGLASATSLAPQATQYFGGEARVEAHSVPTIFIGYGTTSPSATLQVLASYLDPTPSLKWTAGTSPLSNLPGGASAQVVHLPYSDAALFGVVVQAPTVESVREAGKAVVQTVKGIASGAAKEDLGRAIARAKFANSNAIESRDGFLASFGPQLLSGTDAALDTVHTALDDVSASALAQVATDLSKEKPTFVAVGDVHSLPHGDELGL